MSAIKVLVLRLLVVVYSNEWLGNHLVFLKWFGVVTSKLPIFTHLKVKVLLKVLKSRSFFGITIELELMLHDTETKDTRSNIEL